jgi:hypothetical protein
METALPQELFEVIVACVMADGAECAVDLMLTCRLFHSVCERQLYKKIDTRRFSLLVQDLGLHQRYLRFSRYFLLLNTLATSQRIADHVATFLFVADGLPDHDEENDFENCFWPSFVRAFHNLRNLRDLEITRISMYNDVVEPEKLQLILLSAPFQLHKLTWPIEVASRMDDSIIVQCLAQQPSIQEIIFDSPDQSWDLPNTLPSDVLANLQVLAVGSAVCMAFIPGRSIRLLSWTTVPTDTSVSDHDAERLGSFLSQLEELIID